MTQPLSAAKARDLVRTAALPEVLEVALSRLQELQDPGLRDAILDRFRRLMEQGPKGDGGGGLRMALLTALRPIAHAGDVEVFESAVLLIEIGYGKDVVQNLRAAALVGIASLDEPRAAWYATHLLRDRENVSDVTGQPALTAAQLLVSIGRPEPLYLEALRGGGHPEVRAECVRQLTSLPAPLLAKLAEEILRGDDEPLMIGLVDLALAHESLPQLAPVLRVWLQTTDRIDVYRYLVMAAAASRREAAIALLRELLPITTDRHKFVALEGALELLAPSPR
ncbi:MAG TPA: hypothetical protein VF137_08420 [Candidatus Dormibacteraeota bacterium]